jgi:hypothetical protein
MPSTRSLVRLLTPLALSGALLAGCGDDEESLSEEEFVEQANDICEEGSEQLDEEAEEIFGSLGQGEQPSDEDIQAFADTFEENISGQLDDIADLNGPDDLESEVGEILDEARTLVSELADQFRDDPSALFADQGEDPFAEVNERLLELGITECAS